MDSVKCFALVTVFITLFLVPESEQCNVGLGNLGFGNVGVGNVGFRNRGVGNGGFNNIGVLNRASAGVIGVGNYGGGPRIGVGNMIRLPMGR